MRPCAARAAALSPARRPSTVSGTVTDGSGHGWPLYARIEITSASTDPVVVYSDPVTGAYAADLPDATTYTFAVTAVGPGYVPGGGTGRDRGRAARRRLDTRRLGALQRAGLRARHVRASGPLRELRRRRDSAGLDACRRSPARAGRSSTGADPCGLFDGNQTGGSGPYAIVNSDLRPSFEDTYLVTAADRPVVERERGDPLGQRLHRRRRPITAEVEVTIDGGATWTSVWQSPGSAPGSRHA